MTVTASEHPRSLGKYTLLRCLREPDPGPDASSHPPEDADDERLALFAGAVYLAADAHVGQLRVVHILAGAQPPARGQPAGPARLPDLDEARLLTQLNHPSLLQVLDVNQSAPPERVAYAVTEYLPGRDLHAVTALLAEKGRRLPTPLALYIARELARGLAAMHGHGLVHGALSPRHVLCGWRGEVKLTGLGAGRPVAAEKPATPPLPDLPGPTDSPYSAPELRQGAMPTPASDLFALGALLRELLTGKPSEAAPAAELPASLEALLQHALAPDPTARVDTAEALRQALSRELLRLAPDLDAGDLAKLLRELYGDQIDFEQSEHEWLLDSAWSALPRRPTSGRPPGAAAPSPSPGQPLAAPSSTGTGHAAEPSRPQPRITPAPPALTSSSPQTLPLPKVPLSPEARIAHSPLIEGRYRLRRLVGVGGMGAVFEAEHVAIGKRVAVKILHPQFSQHADLVERLRREAQAAARLGHPGIAAVHDFGRTGDDSAYLVMEFLDGTDLGAILRAQRQLPEPRVLHIAIQAVRALAAAHRAGIIHRDLKPENIFLVRPRDWPPPSSQASGPAAADAIPDAIDEQDRDFVKVLDFGIAMQLEAAPPLTSSRPEWSTAPGSAGASQTEITAPRAPRLTSPGLTVGTPEYMAPEQAMGQAVDARADVYAVGALLYEMLCGQVPFAARSASELLTLKTTLAAPPLRSHEPSVSIALAALVQRCLERDPVLRPQSMEELERALLHIAVDEGIAIDALAGGQLSGRLLFAEARGDASGGRGPSSARFARITPSPAPSSEAPASDPSAGKVAVPVSAASTLEHSGNAITLPIPTTEPGHDEQPTQTVPRLPPERSSRLSRWSRTAIGLGIATGLVIVGFATAPLLKRERTDRDARTPSPPPTQLPSEPGGLPAPPALSSVQRAEPALVPPSSTPRAEKPRPPDGNIAMLVEWAKRAAAGGRYSAPAGDNLVELLRRIEAESPGNADAQALREQAQAALVVRAEEQLGRRRALDALHSYRTLIALDPLPKVLAAFPRIDLAQQLATLARATVHRRKDVASQAATAAIELGPSLPSAQLALAEVQSAQGKREEAAAAYRRALELHPHPTERRQAELGLARLAKPGASHASSKHRRGHR